MVDIDLRKAAKNGSFSQLFVEIILVAVSVFVAFRWNTYISEVINEFFPAGNNILEKGFINVLLTLILAWVCFKIVKIIEKTKKESPATT